MPIAAAQPACETLSARKSSIRRQSDAIAGQREHWLERAAFFHEEDLLYLKFLIPAGQRVLELGCGTGFLLAALEPSVGVGIDFSEGMIAQARKAYPHLDFRVGDIEDVDAIQDLPGPFDVILIVDTLGSLDDCQTMFEHLHHLCERHTRIIIGYFSHLWRPALWLAELVGLRPKQQSQNILSADDVRGLVELADFETIKSEFRMLSPLRLFGLGRTINRFVAPWPIIRHFCLRHYSVCRSLRQLGCDVKTASIIIPARNERANIEPAIHRIPHFSDAMEIIFVEGHSKDGTWDEIQRVIEKFPNLNIRALRQSGKGKADAVFAACSVARGDVLLILDADLTMPPEQLPKFWQAIRSGKGEFINGSRLVYPMEDGAMQFLNLIANRLFSVTFTWLLSQRFTDTLCGTKVLRKSDYVRLGAQEAQWGEFDPFGDFFLIFGAAKMGLKVLEVPIRYASRTYGETQISRFRHGAMLIRMVIFAFFRIKAL